jgi:hypothetical protein
MLARPDAGRRWIVAAGATGEEIGFAQPVMTCRACADGRGPGIERGLCRRCMGPADQASRYTYCLHPIAPPQDEEV